MLNKRDSLIVVAQNCPEFTARIIDRWQELEAAVNNPVTPRVTSPYPPMLIETLAAAVDRGLMSKRSAVARLDALLGIALPRRAPRAEPTPVQLPLELVATAWSARRVFQLPRGAALSFARAIAATTGGWASCSASLAQPAKIFTA